MSHLTSIQVTPVTATGLILGVGPLCDRTANRTSHSGAFSSAKSPLIAISYPWAVRAGHQQRLLLEVSFEALEDAGATLENMAGSATGAFVGGFTLDYSQLQFSGAEQARTNLRAHTATGIVMTMLANRISHAFDLLGPSSPGQLAGLGFQFAVDALGSAGRHWVKLGSPG